MDGKAGALAVTTRNIRAIWRNIQVVAMAAANAARPTLRGVTARVVRTHYAQNPAARGLRYGRIRGSLAWLRRRPRLAGVVAILLYGSAVLAAALLPAPSWAPSVRSGVLDAYRDMLAVNVALLGAQATLLGLVYPLVIAMVGMLFEARSTPGGRLQIFFQETEAVAVGGIALGFILAIGLEALSWSALPQNVLVVMTGLNVLWFSANLSGLAFFVLRSLQFLQPSRRQDLVKSYLANTAWRAELFRALLQNRWLGAGQYGDLPVRSDPEDQTWVSIFQLDHVLVSRLLKRRQVLVDINFGGLTAVLAQLGSDTDLRFRCLPGEMVNGEIALASANTTTLSGPARWLVRNAFIFGEPERHRPPLSGVILKEGVADLLALKAAGRYEEFSTILSNTIDLHALLYGLAQATEIEDGDPVSWGELEQPNQWSGSIARDWCRAYVELLQTCADQLGSDGRYFEACANIPTRLMWRGDDVRASALDTVLDLSNVTVVALIDGAARRHVEALGAPPPRGQLFATAGAGAAFYRRAWTNFVGAWESLGEAILREVKGEDWELFGKRRALVQRHLRDTAMMASRAAKSGDRDAIGWTTDMLLKWYGQFAMRWRANRGWALHRPLVILPLLARPFAEVQQLGIAHLGQNPNAREVIDAIFENTWLDTLVVVSCSMIGLIGEGVGPILIEDGPARCVSALFLNESFDPQASNHPHSAPLDVQAILFSILRLVGSGERFDPSYHATMGHLAEAIDQLDGPNFINARVYSWVGMADIQGQALAQAILLMAAIELRPGRNPGGVAMGDSLLALLLPEADRHKRRLAEHLNQVLNAIAGLDPLRGQALLGTLRQSGCSATEYDERAVGARAILEACRDKIAEIRQAAIASATIDPARLRSVAEDAARGISKDATTFPFYLFGAVEITNTPQTAWTLRHGTNRGEYTMPLMAQPLSGEDEWWARTMEGYAGVLLFRDVIAKGPFTRRAPGTPLGWWRACKEAFAAIEATGQTPMIVRATGNEPRWLSEWQWNTTGGRPADMTFTYGLSPGAGYDFHVNGVPVFECNPAGTATWIFGREILEIARFCRLPNGLPIDVTFEADPDPWKGALLLSLQHGVVRGVGPIWRINHLASPRAGGSPPAPRPRSARHP